MYNPLTMFQPRWIVTRPTNVGRSENTSTDEMIRCFGMPCGQWKRVQYKMLMFSSTAALKDGIMMDYQVRLLTILANVSSAVIMKTSFPDHRIDSNDH